METTKYRLLKDPINAQLKRLGQTYRSVSKYMTENQDDNWLANRTNKSRSTLVEWEHVKKLAWLLGVNPEEIADEVDATEYRRSRTGQGKEIIITITQDQWNNLLHLMTSAVRNGVALALEERKTKED